MQVHLFAQRAAPLAGVDKVAGKLEAEADVVTAAAPLPVADARHHAHVVHLRFAVVVRVIASARLDRTFAARPRHTVRYRRAGDRVDKCRFTTTC